MQCETYHKVMHRNMQMITVITRLCLSRRHVPSLQTMDWWKALFVPEIQALKAPNDECRRRENRGAEVVE